MKALELFLIHFCLSKSLDHFFGKAHIILCWANGDGFLWWILAVKRVTSKILAVKRVLVKDCEVEKKRNRERGFPHISLPGEKLTKHTKHNYYYGGMQIRTTR